MGKYLVILALTLLPLGADAQMKVYTRSVKLKDFTSKTTKVVLGGTDDFNTALREEVFSLWSISPYEFCNAEDFKKIRTNNDYYFLHPEVSAGIVFLVLEKGGKAQEADPLKQGFTLASLPICGEKDSSGDNLQYMAAFVDIIQNFMEAALRNESVSYKGIKASTQPKGRGAKPVTLDIKPDPASDDGPRYRLVFDEDTHVLYSYGRFAR